jgi:hypothetical protein
MATKSPKTVSVADYLAKAIDLSGLTQRELAAAVGYPKPNVISMMKLGQTKIPMEKVPVFARALGLDPAHFTRLAMREYMPDVWEALESVFGESLTDRERRFVEILRETDPSGELQLDPLVVARVKDALRNGGETA